jgi:hypothetical protein
VTLPLPVLLRRERASAQRKQNASNRELCKPNQDFQGGRKIVEESLVAGPVRIPPLE